MLFSIVKKARQFTAGTIIKGSHSVSAGSSRRIALGLSMLMAASAGSVAEANTLVRVTSTYGDFTLELFDDQTPNTVNNFLGYVDRGDFDMTVVHRSVSNFVIQMGAYNWLGDCVSDAPQPGINCSAVYTQQQDPVVNEPVVSNTEGTIAMAKLGGNPNSATSQWFINLGDNSENLDEQNGGFTAFGRVLGDGLEVANEINGLEVVSVGGAATEMPQRNNPTRLPQTDNLVLMSAYRVDRFSTAMHIFEYSSGRLAAYVNAGDLGNYSMQFNLVEGDGGVIFELDTGNMVPLEITPEGMANYLPDEQKVAIPQVEINNNGSVSVLNNVVLHMIDESQMRFELESYE
ncbi:MAG: peptidylprolyl isomerase [Pseudohongiella nitratireducens]|nr:peptidylprolyl isomerase [Pseudohongiella nitratireducens]